MSVLLAVGDPDFTNIMRKSLLSFEGEDENGNKNGFEFDVLDTDVLHRNYLNEIIEQEKPSMVILHDVYLPSDFSTQAEMDDEMLQLVSFWRSKYDNDLRVVYICDRERKDPFLSHLVARNVLDIFNERTISEKTLITQLAEEPRFINVSRFGIGDVEIEFDEIPEEEATIEVLAADDADKDVDSASDRTKAILSRITETTKSVVDAGTEWNKQRVQSKQEQNERLQKEKTHTRSRKNESPGKKSKKESSELELSDVIDLMPIPKEVYRRTQVIGTVVIGVAGVKAHMGATHTAMSIATFLRKRKNSVALIELNNSEDFDRIHALYEGEKHYLRNESTFDYKGVDHYKYREDIRLGEIMATYEYVVLDFGSIEDTLYYQEFLRSHVRVLLVSPYEWKQHWTDDFGKQVQGEEDTFLYVVPFAEKGNVKDMEERLPDLSIVSFPASSNPYQPTKEVEDAVSVIMTGYLKDGGVRSSKKTILAAVLASSLITTVVIAVFAFL